MGVSAALNRTDVVVSDFVYHQGTATYVVILRGLRGRGPYGVNPVASALAKWRVKWLLPSQDTSSYYRRAYHPDVLINPAIYKNLQDAAQALPHSKSLW